MDDQRAVLAAQLRAALLDGPDAVAVVYSALIDLFGPEQASRLLLEVASAADSSAVTG